MVTNDQQAGRSSRSTRLTTGRRRLVALGAALVLLAAGATAAWAHADPPQVDRRAQEPPASTPVPLIFPTATPPLEVSGTPTRTPTQGVSGAFAEALTEGTNVRAGPDIDEVRLGQIAPGSRYPILGRRFNWYLIEFVEGPGGRAWVYNEVVQISGDPAAIPELELEQIATSDPLLAAAEETALAITATPGFEFTLTAESFITPAGVFTAAPGSEVGLTPGQPLPTYTFPAATATPLPIPRSNPAPVVQSGLPPIIPIMALGALGLMGLLVALMRRL
jgi:hypothetical protein